MRDEEFKEAALLQLMPRYDKVEVYEDKLDNIRYFQKRLGEGALSYFLVERYSRLLRV